MSAPNTFSSLNANFKMTYADKIEQLVPENVKLLNLIPFIAADKQPGLKYNQPVILRQEHGVTFATSDEDAVNLNAPIAGGIENAQIQGSIALLRSQMGYVAAQRAAQGGKQAFESATKYLVD